MSSPDELIEIKTTGEFSLVSKADEGRFIIGGTATWDMVDPQGDKITQGAFDEAFNRMMKVPERRNLMLHHTNLQIGRLLQDYVDKSGKHWKPGPMGNGYFIIAELFDDVQRSIEIRKLMQEGHFLSFSIGAQALKKNTKCDDQKCYVEVTKMDLFEVTACERGVNQSSKAFIMSKEEADKLKKGSADAGSEEKIMSQPTDVVQKSDEQLILEAINELKGLVKAIPAPQPIDINAIAEAVKAVMPKPEAPVAKEACPVCKKDPCECKENKEEPEPAPAPVEKELVYDKPIRENFQSEEVFNKSFANYEKFRAEIEKAYTDSMTETLTKSAPPPPPPVEQKPESKKKVDIKKLWETAAGAGSIAEVVEKVEKS